MAEDDARFEDALERLILKAESSAAKEALMIREAKPSTAEGEQHQEKSGE